MVKYEKKERAIIEKTPVKVICDICGKEVDPSNWFRINTHHFDWGNDWSTLMSLRRFVPISVLWHS